MGEQGAESEGCLDSYLQTFSFLIILKKIKQILDSYQSWLQNKPPPLAFSLNYLL